MSEIKGVIEVIYPAQQVTATFRKREIVIRIEEEINGNTYTNYAKMQTVQNKCDILDKFSVGQSVNAQYNVKGNKYEKDGKTQYITNLDLWRLEAVSQGQTAANAPTPSNQSMSASDSTGSGVDDLPF